MTGKQAILSEVIAARDEARTALQLLPIEARERFFDLEAQLETLQLQLAAGRGGRLDPLLREAQDLARQMLLIVRRRAA